MRWAIFALVILILVSAPRVEAAGSVPTTSEPSGKLILERESTVAISAWLGKAQCRVGQVNLIKPEIKLVSSSSVNLESKLAVVKKGAPIRSKSTIIYNYAVGTPSIVLGPYPAGTEIVLGIESGSYCKTTRVSTDKFHTSLNHNGGNSWTIAFEDWKDNDIDDVFVEVTVQPVQEIKGIQVFADNPIYKLPFPANVSHKITTKPGVSEHSETRAYDFDMKIGDLVLTSEMGLVLWVEDSFGSGGPLVCPDNLSTSVKNYWGKRGNVVVIQTEAGVNQTYVHLQQGSIVVKVGDVVTQGQHIANAGNSGFVCSKSGNGSHLHIEWQKNCYDLEQAKKWRTQKSFRVGEPTFRWSCSAFAPDSPYSFTE